MCGKLVSMESFSVVTSFWIIVVCLGGVAINQVMGSGPDFLQPLPVYNYSMSDCSRFRNKTILRPQFIVWPEDTGLIHFKYCCEYQPNGASSTFELSKFSYFPNSEALQLAPYFDVGIVDRENYENLWWPHWMLWRLVYKRRRPMLYCEVSDLRRLYLSRFWRKALRKGTITWVIIIFAVALPVFSLAWLGRKRQIGVYNDRDKGRDPCVDSETEARHERVRFNKALICTSWKALCRGLLDLVLSVSALPIVVVIFFLYIFKSQSIAKKLEPDCPKPKRSATAGNGGAAAGNGGAAAGNGGAAAGNGGAAAGNGGAAAGNGGAAPGNGGAAPVNGAATEEIRSQCELRDEQKPMLKHIRELIKPQLYPSLNLEEGFADASHILLVVLVASGFMEGIAHSHLLSWRAEVMYNASVAYTYLTLFAVASVWIRHCLFLELQHEPDWRWQKVFAQLVALTMVGTYLVLVEDVTEHSLDSFAGPVIGTCVAASVWSAGVEMVVIVRYLWQKLGRNLFRIIFACMNTMPTTLFGWIKDHLKKDRPDTVVPSPGSSEDRELRQLSATTDGLNSTDHHPSGTYDVRVQLGDLSEATSNKNE